jgi:hypothetical protein
LSFVLRGPAFERPPWRRAAEKPRWRDGIGLAPGLTVAEAAPEWGYDEPTVMWRMRRADGGSSHAVIDPRQGTATVIWFVNNRPLGIREFDDLTSAMRWSEQLRLQNWTAGWRLARDH